MKSLAKVKAMRTKPMDPRIQVQLAAPQFPRMLPKPGDHRCTRAARPVSLGRDQVVDIDVLAPGELQLDHEPGDAQHLAVGFNNGNDVSQIALFADLREQAVAVESGPEFQEHGRGPLKVCICLGDSNGHGRMVLVSKGGVIIARRTLTTQHGPGKARLDYRMDLRR